MELLKLEGEMVAIGNSQAHEVEPLIGKPSLMLKRPDGSILLLMGMTQDECRSGAQAFMDAAAFTVQSVEA